ncbi:hypothetical protein BMS3Abin15_00183 [bacterium BMS3Abin15]|nr:hypothetical protein BMS3Abin15_00183 [bacterium BMS3Abin15]
MVSRLYFRFIIPIGYKESWIPLFDDGSGDGYFYDPLRKASEGALFYNFAEQGDFVFFPSMNNLLAAIVKCYQEGAFILAEDKEGPYWEENFELSKDIWSEFGARISPAEDLIRGRKVSGIP